MIQKNLIIAIGLFFFTGTSMAQNDSKITVGVVAYDQGDYAKAEQSLRAALKDESKLKQKNVAKGWYYLGMSLTGIVNKATQDQDTETLQKYDKASLESYHCYIKSVEKDTDNQYEKLVKPKLSLLFNDLLRNGLMCLTQDRYDDAMDYLNAAVTINEEILEKKNYMVYDLRAQTYLGQTDTINAKADFISAIEVFNKYPPKNPDFLFAYVYYRLALLARYKDNNLNESLKHITDGKAMLEEEYGRFSELDYQASFWAKLSQQYEKAKADLSVFELDILLNSPDKLQEAIDKFDSAIKNEPQNYLKHVAYAQLLERADTDKSIAIYKKAITIDGTKHIAYFNLAALYVNRGLVAAQKANEALEAEEVERHEEELKNNLKKALPYLEKAYEISPNDLATINSLIQVTLQLGMEDHYKKYKEAKNEITGR